MPKNTITDIQFLAGGGEMGQLIREKDWSNNPLGIPQTWPQSLRTTLGILLNSKFPMFLWWGPELICFYNDAYRPSLGKEGKHPSILGMNASEAWPEIWDIIKPLIDQVLATGEATWNEDALIPIYRNNKIEDVYWTFSYSPVYDEDSEVAGVLVTCNETTDKVNAFKELKENNQRFLNNISQAPVAMCILRGKEYVVEMANDLMLEIWGKETSVVMNEPLFKGLPEIQDQGIKAILDGVYTTGEKFVANEWEIDLLRNGKIETAYVNFVCEALIDSDGIISGILGTATEITKQVEAHKKIERNEERLNIVIEASELGTWELNFKAKEVEYSQRYLEIVCGLKEPIKLTHEQLKKHIHPDDMEIRDKALNDALTNGYLHYEGRVIWDDKSVHWMEGRGKVFYDEHGEPEKMIGTIRDITNERMFTQELEKQVNERTKELKKLNETLKQSEKRYHLMVEEVQDYAILYITKEGIVENWNKGAEKIKGYKAEEIIGKSFSTFYTHEDRKNHLPQHLLNQAALHGRYRHEGWRVRKDGTFFWASVTITAVHNNDKEVIGFSKVTHDLTSKKEADDKIKLNAAMLEQKNIELEKMNKELQSFAYISSHDLQEPLRKIQTFADQIAERESENLTENGKDKFRRMQNAAKRMQALINDLLAYSRTNTNELNLTKTNLNEIIEDVKEDLKEELQLKNTTIEINELGEADIIPFQFHQLMFNLISNSIKFSKENVPLHIKIKGEIANGEQFNNDNLKKEIKYSHITFSDNGIGFEQQYSKKIFEVFQRLHGKEVYEGTGIGLAIVKKIIDNHNGVITANSELGKGATFDIYIPLES